MAELRRFALLKNLEEDELRILERFLEARQGERGDVLYAAGDLSDACFFLLEGQVEFLTEAGVSIKTAGAGESFGELSVLQQGRRALTARALERTSLLSLSVAQFLRLRAQHPDVCLALVMAIVGGFLHRMERNKDVLARLAVSLS
jgi:CRP-like cAMP-binding protein